MKTKSYLGVRLRLAIMAIGFLLLSFIFTGFALNNVGAPRDALIVSGIFLGIAVLLLLTIGVLHAIEMHSKRALYRATKRAVKESIQKGAQLSKGKIPT